MGSTLEEGCGICSWAGEVVITRADERRESSGAPTGSHVDQIFLVSLSSSSFALLSFGRQKGAGAFDIDNENLDKFIF